MAERGRSFLRRWLAGSSTRVAAWVLCAWVTAALGAPFLANDLPYWMRAIDYGGFEGARTSLEPIARSWLELEALGEEGWRATAAARSGRDYASVVALERGAVESRLRTLKHALDASETEALGALDRLEAGCRGPDTPRDRAGFEALVHESVARLQPARPGNAGGGVRLATRTSTPLLAGVSTWEAALAAAWLALLASLIPTRRWSVRLLVAGVVFALVALTWRTYAGEDPGPASIKLAAARGELVVEAATFPPLPMGCAETHMREAFQPPSWIARDEPREFDPFGRPVDARAHAADVRPFEPPLDSAWRHPLGTDSLGRDLAARLLWGARVSLFVGAASAVLLTLVGIVLGLASGWRGGWTDFAVSRAIEVVACFPAFVLVLCAMFFVDPATTPPLFAVAGVIGLVGWTSVARLVRAEVLRVRELAFVTAARALGLPEGAILRRHVLLNSIQPAIIAFAFAVGAGILTESALSFLGFGVQVPVPSWGALISDSRSPDHPWIWIVPGLAIFSVVASCNLLGEALRDALDPRHGR